MSLPLAYNTEIEHFSVPSSTPTVSPSSTPTVSPSSTPTVSPSSTPTVSPSDNTNAHTEVPIHHTLVPAEVPAWKKFLIDNKMIIIGVCSALIVILLIIKSGILSGLGSSSNDNYSLYGV